MARRTTKAKPTTSQSPEYLRGVFAALEAMRVNAPSTGLQQDEVVAVAKDLGVPVLFVEAAMAYERADVDELAAWWTAAKGAS